MATPSETLYFYTGFELPMIELYNRRVAEAFHRIGIKAKVVYQPAQRSLRMANIRGAGAAGRVPHLKQLAPDATQNLLRVDESIAEIDIVVYTVEGVNFEVTGWESLRPYRSGFRMGAKIMEKNVPAERPRTMITSNEQLFRMLDSGRLDTVVEFRITGDAMVKKLGLKKIRALATPLISLPFHLYIHKEHEKLLPDINRALRATKEDGSYQRHWDEIVLPMLQPTSRKATELPDV